MLHKIKVFFLVVALAFSPVSFTVSSGIILSHAEAGLFKKLLAGQIALALLKMASAGVTETVKRSIIAFVKKHANDPALPRKIISKLDEYRGDKKYGQYVDQVKGIIDDAFPAVAKKQLADKAGDAVAYAAKYWNRVVNYGPVRVFQRNDLIDPKRMHKGKTNLDLMKDGKAPIGPDGKQLQLHHMLQKDGESLAEVGADFHKGYHKALHINPQGIPSGINRVEFDLFRAKYWKDRALDF
ncbi:HNH/ENDO VII family nuclease [Rhizobium sp. MHM7A]|uniref:HNH/ENDO VII family nuclease n=1 Tax=Rhizobium sp. MHM7A TaxID=2583233 RepID=UPI0011071D75|nr:HNH/ENDO VII family nuclease [Rhizobium sp. MHM7A]TLX17157.1 hypothetical protein FFR93_07560 [Rhizobium sp. MHM7A]